MKTVICVPVNGVPIFAGPSTSGREDAGAAMMFSAPIELVVRDFSYDAYEVEDFDGIIIFVRTRIATNEIAEKLAATPGTDFDTFVSDHPDLMSKDLLLRWYDRDRLDTDKARSIFLMPVVA